jgi:signal transduction histidine kinase
MLGAQLTRFIPERYRADHQRHVQGFGQSGVSTRRMAAQRVVTGLRTDGEEFPLDASISQLTTGDRKLFTVILRDITETQKARLALEQSHAELRELTAALETVREEERKRIARELHDDLGQQLTAIRMDAHFIRAQAPAAHAEIAQSAERLERTINQTVVSLRRISADLRPMMLDDLGLVAALEELASQVSERSGLRCSFAGPEDLDVDERLVTPLYRIAQESLNNVVKHAGATEAALSLFRDDAGRLVLRVEDNGKGIAAEDRRKRKSFGLIGMRERVHAVGGDFSIVSRPPAGTLVEVAIPGTPASPGPATASLQP